MTNPALATLLRQPSGRLDLVPYAAMLDLSFERVGDELQLVMPFAETLIGSPGRLHGGSIGGLLELAGLFTVIAAQPEGEARRMLDSTLYHWGERHGHELSPACKVTIVDKRTNEKKRHYRVNEYRLFFGDYSTFVLELGTTQDQLDIDPHRVLSVHHVLDDADLRATSDAKELKQKVTAFMRRGRNPAEG